jgi:glycosyltransferase involved in cell wall biosynthesis
VVPSYNQADYLEETLLSILHQNYPNLELIVIDGGSTDHSVQVIQKYEKHIAYWVSEKDRGQSHAINKGFERATGEWVAWMNSDDCYLEGAFHFIFHVLDHKKYDFLHGNCSSGESLNQSNYRHTTYDHKKSLFHLLLFFHSAQYIIPSQSVFVRRSLLQTAKLLDESYHYCMDLEWFSRIYTESPRKYFYKKGLCFFRKNFTTKTSYSNEKGWNEAVKVARTYAGHLSDIERAILDRLILHSNAYKKSLYVEKPTLGTLLSTFFNYPLCSLYDLNYFGLLKKVILRNGA